MPQTVVHNDLSPLQARFAAQIAQSFLDPNAPQTYADAYRAAQPNTRAKDKTIWEQASRLASDSKVRARVAELIEAANELANAENAITVDDVRTKLEDLRDKAENSGQFGPAVRAEELRGKTIKAFVDVYEREEDLMDVESVLRLILSDFHTCVRLIDAFLAHNELRSVIMQKTADIDV